MVPVVFLQCKKSYSRGKMDLEMFDIAVQQKRLDRRAGAAGLR
jgi:hypothetical protein